MKNTKDDFINANDAEILQGYTGTEKWMQYHGAVITDGSLAFAENLECFWFLDTIAFNFRRFKEKFQVWKINKNEDESAEITCEDGNNRKIYTQKIEYTTFPYQTGSLWCINGTIILPSEY